MTMGAIILVMLMTSPQIKSEGMLELLDCTWTMDTRHQRQGSADWKGVVIADKGGCCIANNCTFKVGLKPGPDKHPPALLPGAFRTPHRIMKSLLVGL